MVNKHLYNYLNTANSPNVDEYLDYVYDKMFTSYILKTLRENQKSYFIKKNIEQERFVSFDCTGVDNTLYHDDESDIMFDTYISILSPKQYRLMNLYFKIGFNDTEIAELMHTSKQAVGAMKKRALEKIRKEFFTNEY